MLSSQRDSEAQGAVRPAGGHPVASSTGWTVTALAFSGVSHPGRSRTGWLLACWLGRTSKQEVSLQAQPPLSWGPMCLQPLGGAQRGWLSTGQAAPC